MGEVEGFAMKKLASKQAVSNLLAASTPGALLGTPSRPAWRLPDSQGGPLFSLPATARLRAQLEQAGCHLPPAEPVFETGRGVVEAFPTLSSNRDRHG